MEKSQIRKFDTIDFPMQYGTFQRGVELLCNGSYDPTTITNVTVEALSVDGSTSYLTETAAALTSGSWQFNVPANTLPLTTSPYQLGGTGMGPVQGGASDSFVRIRVKYYEGTTLTTIITRKVYIATMMMM